MRGPLPYELYRTIFLAYQSMDIPLPSIKTSRDRMILLPLEAHRAQAPDNKCCPRARMRPVRQLRPESVRTVLAKRKYKN